MIYVCRPVRRMEQQGLVVMEGYGKIISILILTFFSLRHHRRNNENERKNGSTYNVEMSHNNSRSYRISSLVTGNDHQSVTQGHFLITACWKKMCLAKMFPLQTSIKKRTSCLLTKKKGHLFEAGETKMQKHPSKDISFFAQRYLISLRAWHISLHGKSSSHSKW